VQLTTYRREFLADCYYRAQAGGAAPYQAIATNPIGARGLLINYRASNLLRHHLRHQPGQAPGQVRRQERWQQSPQSSRRNFRRWRS
jgi:hypothetical protein